MGESDVNVMTGTKVPALRFKGFSDEWVEKKLGGLGVTYTGLKGKTKADFGVGDGEYVTFSNIMNNGIADINLTDKTPIDDSQNEVLYGDVLFTISSETFEEVGMSSVWLDNRPNVYLNSFSFGYRPSVDDIDSPYLGYLLRSENIRRKFIRLGQGISRINISKNRIMDVGIPIPELPEQQQIGQTFKTIDSLIQSEEQKLEQLNALKKSFLQKMFPKKGATAPELRFDGFSGEWVEKTLGDVVDFTTAPSKSKKVIDNGMYKVMDMGSVSSSGDNISHKLVSENNDLLVAGDLIMPKDDIGGGLIIGRTAYIDEDNMYVQGDHVYRLRVYEQDKHDSLFLHYSINTDVFNTNLKRLVTGSAQLGIRSYYLEKELVGLPSLPEQQAIGQFFKTLDELIVKQEEKVDNGKLLKKALLQKMFV